MNRKALFVVIAFIVIVGIGAFKIISAQTKGVAGLKVVVTPVSSVFLNDKSIGHTPLEVKEPSGEYILKIIPDDTVSGATTWQGKINLVPSVLTYVHRDLGTSELTSAGEIVTLEKISGQDAQIAVVSKPDAATVIVDGQERGTTPLTVPSVSTGEHDVAASTTGFTSRTVRVATTPGYRLMVDFQLALSPENSSASATPSPTGGVGGATGGSSGGDTFSKPYVVIKDTPTGFLRVRMSPSLSATEVAQLKPGVKVPYLDTKGSWFHVTYDTGKDGWVSGQYATKVE
jgi:uncharacterized protein YgiM (DUF1202 family)